MLFILLLGFFSNSGNFSIIVNNVGSGFMRISLPCILVRDCSVILFVPAIS